MKRMLSSCAKFVLTALITFVCFELYFLTTEISLPSVMRDDPVLGRAFQPNARAALVQEGFHMDRVNPYGLFGPPYPPQRTEGTLRIALVGDSFIEASQLFPRWNLRTVLEEEFGKLTGRRVEVLNFGLTGHTLRTMYASNKDLVSRFQPDVTLIFVVNESFNNRDYRMGPHCLLDGEGNLAVNYDFAKSDEFRRKTKLVFTRRLASFQIMQGALGRHRLGHTPKIVLGKFAPRGAKKAVPKSSSEDPNFELNRAVIRDLGRLDLSGGSRIIIVGHRNVPSYYLPVIKEAGLFYIDLQPEFENLQRSGTDVYSWPHLNLLGHWNHEGHGFVGRYLAKRLSETDFIRNLEFRQPEPKSDSPVSA